MLADFFTLLLSNDMKITVQKNHLGGQIVYRSLVPPQKRISFSLRRPPKTEPVQKNTGKICGSKTPATHLVKFIGFRFYRKLLTYFWPLISGLAVFQFSFFLFALQSSDVYIKHKFMYFLRACPKKQFSQLFLVVLLDELF